MSGGPAFSRSLSPLDQQHVGHRCFFFFIHRRGFHRAGPTGTAPRCPCRTPSSRAHCLRHERRAGRGRRMDCHQGRGSGSATGARVEVRDHRGRRAGMTPHALMKRLQRRSRGAAIAACTPHDPSPLVRVECAGSRGGHGRWSRKVEAAIAVRPAPPRGNLARPGPAQGGPDDRPHQGRGRPVHVPKPRSGRRGPPDQGRACLDSPVSRSSMSRFLVSTLTLVPSRLCTSLGTVGQESASAARFGRSMAIDEDRTRTLLPNLHLRADTVHTPYQADQPNPRSGPDPMFNLAEASWGLRQS